MAKIKVTFKTPDAVEDAVKNFNGDWGVEIDTSVFDKFVKYNEYVTIEFDTETQTATVLEV